MESQNRDSFLEVTVGSPIMHRTWEDGQYTSYAIFLETNYAAFTLEKSSVRRRFSEFTHLRKLIRNQHCTLTAPPLPSKLVFEKQFSYQFIEKRRAGLEKFIQKVLSVPLYLSNRAVHLFIQSNLPMHRIELIVEGRSSEILMCEPHLILNQQSFYDSSISYDVSDSDVTDYESSNHMVNSSSYSSLIRCVQTHGYVSQGSQISICSPSLHVPKSNLQRYPQYYSTPDSQDSDYDSVLASSSPKQSKKLTQRPESHSSNDSIPAAIQAPITVRKKKVSFCSDITHSIK